jgi:hypothetical protein
MAGGSFGYSVAGVGDVNGDVQSDFIVGAPAESNGQTAEGRAYVYRGIAGTSRPTVISTTESNQANANYGFSVAGAGDLNGDGYADVLVGAPNYDGSKIDEGRVFGYFGDGTATPLKNSFFKEAGQAGASFGISVSSAGDTDGDGRSEMLVGASQYDNGQNNEGAVFHYRGTSGWYQTTPAVTFTGGVQGDQLGLSVATADVNGDGYADLVIGEPQYDNGETNEGRVLVYLGGTVGPSAGATPWSVESNRAGARLGATVANAGDVNGDGFADIVVGAPNYANPEVNEGAVFVYFGGTAGFQSTSWVQEGNAAGLYLGISVAGAGDVNGDGYADLIAGAPGYSNGQSSEGGAFLYLGNSSFTPTQSAWAGQSNQSQSDYGLSVSSAGDVNGDGKGDVIVGARRYDNGQTDEGMAFVYLGGGPNGLQDTPVLLESNVAGSQFATSVAGGFDTGTDGFGDVIVGAPLYSMGQTNEGAVYVYRGSATGIVTMPAKVYESNAANDSWGTMVASAGDFNADGRGDVLIQSPTHGTTGYVSPCFGTGKNAGQGDPLDCSSPRLNATWTTGLIGRSGAAGDVNGDGFSDLIVGTPDYSTGTATVGRVDFYFANAQDSNLRGVALALQARRPNLTVAIPAHGRSASTTGFDATVIRPRNPWGYGRVKIQVEAKPLGTPFDGAGLMTSNWFTSGRENAAKLLIGPGVAGNTPHWRARLVYDQVQSPIFQRSRWLYGGQLGEAGAAEVRIMP